MTSELEPLDTLYGFTTLDAPNGQKLKVRVILTRKNARALGHVNREVNRLRGDLAALAEELNAKPAEETNENDVERVEELDEQLAEVLVTGLRLLIVDFPNELAEAESTALAVIFASAVASQRASAAGVITRRTEHPLPG